MRRFVTLAAAVLALAGLPAGTAAANDQAICRNGKGDNRIEACTRLIEGRRLRGQNLAMAYFYRSVVLHRQNQHDRALADVDEAIRLHPTLAWAYSVRGQIHAAKRLPDQAIADYGHAIRLDPRFRMAYLHRGRALADRSEHDRAIADLTQAVRLDPRIADAYFERGRVFARKGEHDRAIADYSEAIRLNPRFAAAYNNRGRAQTARGDLDRALADFDQSIRLAPNVAVPYRHRAAVHERKGALEAALADFRHALTLDPRNQVAMEGVSRLEQALGATRPAAVPETKSASAAPAADPAPAPVSRPEPAGQAGSRVALVIGNGAYRHAARLANPANDSADIAAALRRLGFDVVEGHDLDRRGMEDKVREFGRKLDQAGLALFFYAGHGMQVGGRNYLIPTDAKLERAGDLTLDTVDVGQVLAQMEAERRVNLVFLDACRDNPLARSFARSLGTRSTAVGSGLASIQSAIGTMIAYATQPDNVALDGRGRNSPFTTALLKHLATPGLDIGSVMRRVRTDVVQATGGKQVPWDHSSLMGEVVLAR